MSTLFPGFTAFDSSFLNANAAYRKTYEWDPFGGNFTTDTEMNQVLRHNAQLEPFGVVPSTLLLANGNPYSISNFDASTLQQDPLNLKGPIQLTPVAQSIFGDIKPAPSIPFKPLGLPSDAPFSTLGLGFIPPVNGIVPFSSNTAISF
ncbi:MAG: hypothetical protein H2174_00050 [Vampirovibrio sp.]|nr:hypothetical protein [Vampirovibrio sp.]